MAIRKLFTNIILVLCLVGFAADLNGQTANQDSTRIVEQETEPEVTKTKSPKKATIYSAILPGLGQAYNGKYWKIPIIYAGFGALGYSIHWNNENYHAMQDAHDDLTGGDGDSHTEFLPDWLDLTDPNDYNTFENWLSDQADYYRRNRDLLIICTVGFYGLNIIDANVDAHLFDFDISEDLSFNWQPQVYRKQKQTNIYGVSCSFSF